MTETVLVLPVIMVLVAMTLMLGRATTRLQRVSMLDRYEAWRHAVEAPGPGWISGSQRTDTSSLNEALFNNTVIELEVGRDGVFPSAPNQMLVAAARNQSDETGSFTEYVLDRFPNGQRVKVIATFEPTIPLETRLGLTTDLRSTHTRLANEWKYANGLRYDRAAGRWEPAAPYVSMRQPVRDTYLEELDRLLPPSSNEVAGSIRGMYTANPGYRGPYLSIP